jgi:hypothetical protein
VSEMSDLIETTIRNRFARMAEQLNTGLYGDREPPPTCWQRMKRTFRYYCRRVSDAWLVLTGKADIE